MPTDKGVRKEVKYPGPRRTEDGARQSTTPFGATRRNPEDANEGTGPLGQDGLVMNENGHLLLNMEEGSSGSRPQPIQSVGQLVLNGARRQEVGQLIVNKAGRYFVNGASENGRAG